MHYYKFNIGDFDKVTRHSSITERGLFRDLLDLYIKEEKPIISDMKKLERLLCVKTKSEKNALAIVLEDFFILTEEGYFSEFCQSVLNDTTERADIARENGKKGGRPPKQSQSHELPSGNQYESENKAKENPNETQIKPKNNPDENYPSTHNPLPNNQKERVEPAEKTKSVKFDPKTYPIGDMVDNELWCDFVDMRNQIKKPLTEQACKLLAKDFEQWQKDGLWVNIAIGESIKNSWQGVFREKAHTHGNKQQPKFGGVNDPLAVNQKWRPGETGIVAPNTVFDFTQPTAPANNLPASQPVVSEAW